MVSMNLWFANLISLNLRDLGNSQVLPRDYDKQEDIELVLREMAEQVAIRLRREKKQAQGIGLYVGFSSKETHRSINRQQKIAPTNRTKILIEEVIQLFRKHYCGGSVRHLGVRYQNLIEESHEVISLFDDMDQIQKEEKLEETIDLVREQFGFLSIQKASVLYESSRNRERSRLIGGHRAGGAGGLDGLQYGCRSFLFTLCKG